MQMFCRLKERKINNTANIPQPLFELLCNKSVLCMKTVLHKDHFVVETSSRGTVVCMVIVKSAYAQTPS